MIYELFFQTTFSFNTMVESQDYLNYNALHRKNRTFLPKKSDPFMRFHFSKYVALKDLLIWDQIANNKGQLTVQ